MPDSNDHIPIHDGSDKVAGHVAPGESPSQESGMTSMFKRYLAVAGIIILAAIILYLSRH